MKNNANRTDADSGPASIVARRDPSGIACLMKFPERLDAGMNRFPTLQHSTADACVVNPALAGDDGARDRYRPLGVVCRFSDSPFAFPIADISRNDGSGQPLETSDPVGIP